MTSVAKLQDTSTPVHDISAENISEATAEFSSIVDSADIISDSEQCYARSNTPWSSTTFDRRPGLIVLPRTTEDVSAIMKICSRRRIPVTAYAGGTSLPGALTATRGGLCVDFRRMDRVLAVHEDDMDVVVQPGVGWMELNERLEAKGLFFPPDPSPDARIGGMIAMSCSGTNTYRYGTIKEWVIGLTAVLANGTVVRTKHRPRKSSAGYDLTRLLIGSEGTLGLVTEATLKLAALPSNLHVAVVTFPDLYAAVRTGLALTRSGLQVDALELLDDVSLKAINISKLSSKHWSERPTLFLKFSGSPNTVSEQVASANEAAQRNNCESFDISKDRETIDLWWNARKCVAKALLFLKKAPSDIFMSSDAAVPISRLADLMESSQKLLSDCGLPGSVAGHLGDGNIHVAVFCPKQERELGHRIIAEIAKLAVQMEGTITGEHGVGLELRDLLIDELGDEAIDMMRRIKLSLDPLCILNCDKVVRLDGSI